MTRTILLWLLALLAVGCTRSCSEYVPEQPPGTGGQPGTGGVSSGGAAGVGGQGTGGELARCEFVDASDLAVRAAEEVKPRVVGGRPASHPWCVSLQRGGHRCTGSLLSPAMVLTAGHCTMREGDQVVAGCPDRSDLTACQVRTVVRVLVHERYEYWRNGYDLSLVLLDRPVVGLQQATLAASLRYEASAWVSGWGRTCPDCPTSTKLLEAELSLVRASDCRFQMNPTQICATAIGADAASGDSGGPLMQAGPDGKLEVVAVVSGGTDCYPGERCDGIYTGTVGLRAGIRACITGAL